jgi:hypothetical protein
MKLIEFIRQKKHLKTSKQRKRYNGSFEKFAKEFDKELGLLMTEKI